MAFRDLIDSEYWLRQIWPHLLGYDKRSLFFTSKGLRASVLRNAECCEYKVDAYALLEPDWR